MSGELTQFGANRAVLAGMGSAVAAAAAIYLGLGTALPAGPDTASLAAYGSVEVATTGYARQAVTWGSVTGDPSAMANSGAVTFGPFGADPPEVTHAFLCDTSVGTDGNVMAYWVVSTPRDAANGDSLIVGDGDLILSVD